jgi:hypothetical protein
MRHVVGRPSRAQIQEAGLVYLYSLDALVGAGEERLRHSEAERFSGFAVQDQFDFTGLTLRAFRYGTLVPYSGGRISTAGGTGDVPVCSARWWGGRREMASPVTMALYKAIKPMATIPAISTISIWIATVCPRSFRCVP